MVDLKDIARHFIRADSVIFFEIKKEFLLILLNQEKSKLTTLLIKTQIA